MRLKYQLRGLGIGIILTAALLMAFSDDKEASAQTEVVSSVEELSTEIETETASEELATEQETVPMETQSETPVTEEETSEEESTEEPVEEASEEESTEEIVEETSEEGSTDTITSKEDVVLIRIVGGDDSGTVSRKLQTAGLVDNASEFDAYLMQHGYDKKISVGEVEIAKGSSWLEIAEKISGR